MLTTAEIEKIRDSLGEDKFAGYARSGTLKVTLLRALCDQLLAAERERDALRKALAKEWADIDGTPLATGDKHEWDLARRARIRAALAPDHTEKVE